MPFQKGRDKTGGRKPFSKNKINRDVAKLLDELGCNPHEGMAQIAMDPTTPQAIKGKMLAELAQYVTPKLRAVELSGVLGLKRDAGTGATRQRILERLSREDAPSPENSPVGGS